jgi:hypothetical protein
MFTCYEHLTANQQTHIQYHMFLEFGAPHVRARPIAPGKGGEDGVETVALSRTPSRRVSSTPLPIFLSTWST